jgi:hypothetical protein
VLNHFFECPLNISHPDERRDDWWEVGSFVFPELEDTWLKLEARSALADASVVGSVSQPKPAERQALLRCGTLRGMTDNTMEN